MDMNIKQRIASGALALALLGGTGAAVAAQPTDQSQRGGAAGLVAAVVQVQLDDTVNVEIVDSLNNLTLLSNILNNSPILSNNDIDVVVGDVSILSDVQLDLLNIDLSNADLTVEDLVGVVVVGDDVIAII